MCFTNKIIITNSDFFKDLVLNPMINNICLIGLGYIGKIHLRLLHEHPEWRVAGVFDLDRELTRDLAQMYNVRAFSSFEEALEHSEVVDIATPGSTHFELAKKAVISGKHLFIEEPVTSSLAEAKLLRSLIQEAGVVCQVGHVERYNPAFTAALPYLSEPFFIEVRRLAQYNPRGTDVSAVLDMMVHDLDLILRVVNSNVKKVHVCGNSLVSGTADIVNARIEFENSVVASITTNRMGFKNSRMFNVFTKDNLVSINLLDKITEVIKLGAPTKNTRNPVIDPGHGLPKKEIISEHPIILPTNAINEELTTFHKNVNSNKVTKGGIDDAIRTLELAFDIEEKLKL